jgi:hypothetical protein
VRAGTPAGASMRECRAIWIAARATAAAVTALHIALPNAARLGGCMWLAVLEISSETRFRASTRRAPYTSATKGLHTHPADAQAAVLCLHLLFAASSISSTPGVLIAASVSARCSPGQFASPSS